jgi:plasmid stabilization system protein ParE
VKRFVLTRLAQHDLEIWADVAKDSINGATRILDDLEASIRALARNPGIGHVREDLADNRHRFFPSWLLPHRLQGSNQAIADRSHPACLSGCANTSGHRTRQG